MSINWQNPYGKNSGTWHKGCLHVHCSPASPCASISMQALLNGYLERNYDFLSISDHLAVTVPDDASLSLIPGTEWNSRTGQVASHSVTRYDHIGIYGIDPAGIETYLPHKSIDKVMNCPDNGVLKIANHPNWLIEEHHRLETLLRFGRAFDGIEIYNYTLEFDDGLADATWKWDRLLSMGFPLLGFAGDDSHKQDDIGYAWIMVRSCNNTPKSIFKAIGEGNFYCSTGIAITELTRAGDLVSISLKEKANIRVIGSRGRVLATHTGHEFTWNFNSTATDYIRFHIQNISWQQAWSQPFFYESPV